MPNNNILPQEEAFKIDKELKILKKGINGGFIEIAQRLKGIKEKQLYKVLNYETFESYIAQPDLGFSRGPVYELMAIYEKFVVELHVSPGGLALTDWTKLREIRPYVTEENKEELLSKAKELSRSDLIEEVSQYKPQVPVLPPPKGKYNTIVIDPPWPVEFMVMENRPNQTEMPYPTMTIEKIMEFPLADIAADDCNLFMWTTQTYLPISFEILETWGFKYHVCLTWDKTNGRSLFGFNRRTEFVLYAYKGKITVNQRGKFIDTVFTEKLREHSRKPDIFYEMIKENTPEPRIDVFSREKREGFDQWGNETEKFQDGDK
jgi:N6-adenosine-specific RNA methylase IME4